MASRFFAPATSFGLAGTRPALSDPFRLLQQGMDSLLTDVARSAGSEGKADLMPTPRINVEETENEIRITAELPGVPEDDLRVHLDDDVLTIAGDKKAEQETDRGNLKIVERAFGEFRRMLQLPFSPDPEKVEARYRDGVLTISIPKGTEQRNRSRQIKIKRGSEDAGAAGGAEGGTSSRADRQASAPAPDS
ncbi:MAG: hypothetical protein QOH81_2698 [Sphingomonadales bacterium]|jgi:HSP20 family protein|nr:hypothetical protein [Sphingomonadales bacterium]